MRYLCIDSQKGSSHLQASQNGGDEVGLIIYFTSNVLQKSHQTSGCIQNTQHYQIKLYFLTHKDDSFVFIAEKVKD